MKPLNDSFVLERIQADLRLISQRLVTRMTRNITITLNKSMSPYVEEVLVYRKMNFIDMISIKYQKMSFGEMLIGFDEELDTRIEEQIMALSPAEWMVFQFRDAHLYYDKGLDVVKQSVKTDVIDEFGVLLNEHFQTKRMQRFIERYPWLNK